jgi:hypothetical protein
MKIKTLKTYFLFNENPEHKVKHNYSNIILISVNNAKIIFMLF